MLSCCLDQLTSCRNAPSEPLTLDKGQAAFLKTCLCSVASFLSAKSHSYSTQAFGWQHTAQLSSQLWKKAKYPVYRLHTVRNTRVRLQKMSYKQGKDRRARKELPSPNNGASWPSVTAEGVVVVYFCPYKVKRGNELMVTFAWSFYLMRTVCLVTRQHQPLDLSVYLRWLKARPEGVHCQMQPHASEQVFSYMARQINTSKRTKWQTDNWGHQTDL